jgi:hypothetical protein
MGTSRQRLKRKPLGPVRLAVVAKSVALRVCATWAGEQGAAQIQIALKPLCFDKIRIFAGFLTTP